MKQFREFSSSHSSVGRLLSRKGKGKTIRPASGFFESFREGRTSRGRRKTARYFRVHGSKGSSLHYRRTQRKTPHHFNDRVWYEALQKADIDVKSYLRYMKDLLTAFPAGENEGLHKAAGGIAEEISEFWPAKGNHELHEILAKQMKIRHTSANRLAKELGISDRTIRRIWTETEARTNLDVIVSVCLALHLPPSKSERVINLAGYCLRDTPLERTYRYLLYMCYTLEIRTCNQLLEFAGFEKIPLTSALY